MTAYTGQVQVDFTHNPGDAAHTWTDITNRARAASYRRGRSYERDVIEPSNGSLKLRNDDGALDPTNGSSTFAPNVLPFKRIQHNVTVAGPGTVPIFTGMVERWPQEWDNGYGYAPVAVVDFLTWLGASKLHTACIHEMLADNPSLLLPLDDPAGSTSAANLVTGGNPAAIVSSKFGPGSLVFGTATTLIDTPTAVTLASPSVGTSANGALATYLTASGAPPPVGSGFAVEIWFRTTATSPVAAPEMIFGLQPLWGSPNGQVWVKTQSSGSAGYVTFLGGPVNSCQAFNSTTKIVDGNWHHLVMVLESDQITQHVYIDGALNSTSVAAGSVAFPAVTTPWQLGVESSSNAFSGSGYFLDEPFGGDLANFAVYPAPLTAARVLAHYNAGKNGFAGDTADARITRILGYAGWAATTSLDACTTTMLAATIAGGSALDAINVVATSEGGAFFAAKDGTLTYRSRRTRMQTTASAATFGDGAGETHYIDIAFDFDPTRIFNDVQISRAAAVAVTATSATSKAKYGLRSLAESIQTQSDAEATDEANWLLNSFADPHARVRSITVDAITAPGAWAALLPLEIGSRVTVNRRPVGHTISVSTFVESISWDIVDGRSAKCTLELSPIPLQALIADDATYGICDSTFVAAW